MAKDDAPAIAGLQPANSPVNLFALAEKIEGAHGAVQAVAVAQELVDALLAEILPAELSDELGKVGWLSKWEKMGKKRYGLLRAALLARVGL